VSKERTAETKGDGKQVKATSSRKRSSRKPSAETLRPYLPAGIAAFRECLVKAEVPLAVVERIMAAEYPPNPDPAQESANSSGALLAACEQLLEHDTLSRTMANRSCCKSGFRLGNARRLAREHGHEPLERKLVLLGKLKYMGAPRLDAEGDIETTGVGPGAPCPCWRLKGKVPAQGPMPLSYCLCCAGHFQHHYQKALGLKLRVKKVVSSLLNSGSKLPCVFVFEICA
jgi:hypothetical protein